MKNRQKLTNILSGGIILAVRDDIAKHVKIIKTDGVLWFKLEKLLLNSKEDVFCGVVYIPSRGSKYLTTDCFFRIRRRVT